MTTLSELECLLVLLLLLSAVQLSHYVFNSTSSSYWNWRLDSSAPEGEQKKTVWTMLALQGDDQLRQRIAFALSQIFAISPVFLGYNR
jgi:hypothetical protein